MPWPGNVIERSRRAHDALIQALVAEVMRRAKTRPAPDLADGKGAPAIVGLSEETTCFVSLQYFSESDPFADFVVHEVAHIFHNCKRDTVGLPVTRRREWLLDIDYVKRETFAYSCEAYARIVERTRDLTGRDALAREYGREVHISEVRVDPAEVADILREAAPRRNGWKVDTRTLCAAHAVCLLGQGGPRSRRPEVGRFREEDWAAAKRHCRLSAEEVRMARQLGLNPRKLAKHVPSPGQLWKLPVGEWVRELYRKSHGTPAVGTQATRARLRSRAVVFGRTASRRSRMMLPGSIPIRPGRRSRTRIGSG